MVLVSHFTPLHLLVEPSRHFCNCTQSKDKENKLLQGKLKLSFYSHCSCWVFWIARKGVRIAPLKWNHFLNLAIGIKSKHPGTLWTVSPVFGRLYNWFQMYSVEVYILTNAFKKTCQSVGCLLYGFRVLIIMNTVCSQNSSGVRNYSSWNALESCHKYCL